MDATPRTERRSRAVGRAAIARDVDPILVPIVKPLFALPGTKRLIYCATLIFPQMGGSVKVCEIR